MIPFILAAVGGYLIGDSFGKEIDSKIPKFANGGVTPMRYNDMTKQDWEEYYIESKKDADNKTFHQYYNKYKLLTQPHISYSLDKSKNFEDFYTRLNHYGYRGIDGKVPMMADGGDVDARKTYLYIGKKSDGYYVMVSGNQPNLGGQILESGFTTATEAMDFAKEMAI